MRVFHLTSDLGATANGARLSRLVPALTQRGVEQAIGVLGQRFPYEALLRGMAVTPLPLRRFVDLSGWRAIRATISDFKPHVVHCWGRRAAEAVNIARLPGVDATESWRAFSTFDGGDTRLSRRVDRRILLPPITVPLPLMNRAEARRILGVAESHRVVVCADRFESPTPARIASGAMELLKFASPDWRLVIIGDGPARNNVERASIKLASDDNRIRFVGIVADIAPFLAAADCVWQTRPRGGLHFILDALTAGVPIITVDNPDLAAILDNSNSLRAADSVALAAVTNELFQDETRLVRLRRGAQAVATRYPVEAAVELLLYSYSDS